MALTINGKKVLGYALGENEYLSGNGAENLNAFFIDGDNNSEWNHQSFTIDMTKYFNQADAKYSDVQYYQIIVNLFYKDADNNFLSNNLLTPLLKRGEINNKRSQNEGDPGAISVWFTDNTTLAVRTKSYYDNSYPYTNLVLAVYGFTSQDVGSVS
ncbi:enterobactin-iron receptor [Lactobacillus crispatus]|uniref:enterobactin-iron receptor n=1 Tax=Lactobacillus crispatus TaxID=47770 RepID=UPI00105D1009|nr:enterobactin-iron receptor [Lactobacillus crispatus]TDM88298.1 enterobactin-iron receptor [Lactobacillus crispatus]TDM96601.1 enterobactin-iron receptor [Lactobacillus crispatus]TDN28366.1 enterobactin-iron receptor [Lactobacillus crispatus]